MEKGTLYYRVVIFVAVPVAAHLLVLLVRRLGKRAVTSSYGRFTPKARTLGSLLSSSLVFLLYFAAIGLILSELGVSLKAYLASASIIALAIGFGSQGFVQDLVTGLTLIFADLFSLGDMVEIAGKTGVVKHIGLRFTVLVDSLGAEIYIPNRTIGNVLKYPRGYVRCLVDVTLPEEDAKKQSEIEHILKRTAVAALERFPGIVIDRPTLERKSLDSSNKIFTRVAFHLWPGRGDVIERSFIPEAIHAIKNIDAGFADWMVTLNYEVEKKPVIVRGARSR